jgi:hypothetical protein
MLQEIDAVLRPLHRNIRLNHSKSAQLIDCALLSNLAIRKTF